MDNKWLETAKKIQAIAQCGLTYGKDKFDLERYEELRDISIEMMAQITDLKEEKIRNLFANETGYQTPKVDIRGVVFKEDKILMVKEKIDGCWSLPGGWGDIGLTPGEVAVKEVKEETGLDVKARRLIAVLDKKCHPHPPSLYHVYKIFILCEVIGGEPTIGIETTDIDFFDRNSLPSLSVERNTEYQINLMFDFLDNPRKEVVFD